MFRRDKENEPTPPDEDGWPRQSDLRRWRQRLASERAEAAIDRDLAQRRTGEERDILLALAAAEAPMNNTWLNLLGDQVGKLAPLAISGTCMPGFLARHFGSVFVLALIQRAEARSTYDADADGHLHHGCR